MKIRWPNKNIFLTLFVLVSVAYGYANANDVLLLKYISKLFITPMITLYYLASSQNSNKLFLVALFFIFCENILAISSNQQVFVVAMGFALLFILINMIIIAERIGQIVMKKLLIILVPFIVSLGIALYLIFKDGGQITWLFYVLGIIIAIYGSFSVYLYKEERSKGALLNLIGVLFFISAAVVKGVGIIHDTITFYKTLNLIFYTISLFVISLSYVHFDRTKNYNSNGLE